MATVQHNRTTAASIFQIGFSRLTKCANIGTAFAETVTILTGFGKTRQLHTKIANYLEKHN